MATLTTHYSLTKPANGEVADATVIDANFDIIDSTMFANAAATTAKYTKPSGGIPESDLSTSVQGILDSVGGSGSIGNWAIGSNAWLIAMTNSQSFSLTAITRDANEAITTATVVWPDGTGGTFTTDTVSTAFPGSVDAYHVTWNGSLVKTVTQALVTRDAAGAVVAQPALTVA